MRCEPQRAGGSGTTVLRANSARWSLDARKRMAVVITALVAVVGIVEIMSGGTSGSSGRRLLLSDISVGSVAHAAPLEQVVNLPPERRPAFLPNVPHVDHTDVLRGIPSAAIRQDIDATSPDMSVSSSTSTIEVTFDGLPDPSFAIGVEIGMQVVADFWESNVPVKVLVRFEANASHNFVAQGRPVASFSADGLSMPVALFDAYEGEDVLPGLFDIEVDINLQREWFTALAGSPPSHEFDLPSVIIREMMHGLFLYSEFYVHHIDTDVYGSLTSAHPSAYDLFVGLRPEPNEGACALYGYLGENFPHDDPWWIWPLNIELGRALTSNRVSFLSVLENGTIAANSLYSPSNFSDWVSIVTLDGTSENYDECDRLMSFEVPVGRSVRCIGPVTRNMLSSVWSAIRDPQSAPPRCAPRTNPTQAPSPTPTPTPTPAPTVDPGSTAIPTPDPTQTPTSSPNPSPTPVCIDSSWVAAEHAGFEVHSSPSFAEVLCYGSLPCATHGHVVARGGRLLTMGELCATERCELGKMWVNGVQHRRSHLMPCDGDVCLTTLDARVSSAWKRFENNAVHWMLRSGVPALTDVLTRVQLRSAAR